MKVTILGAGPAGLYCGLLLKKANPAHDIEIVERNAPDATYGWGVVFSDRTLASFQEADHKTYRAIIDRFVRWETIDVYYKSKLVRCGGHVFAGLARKELLALLQRRCAELGVALRFHSEIGDLAELGQRDLIIAADGVNSLVRKTHAEVFQPSLSAGRARYIWLGAAKVLDAFTFIFRQNEAGLFQVHAYPFDGTTSTVIVECAEETWQRAGLASATEAESVAYCERLFAPELGGCRLLPNNSRWISFITVKNATWRHGNTVLLGDAAHTAHFSIGSGTKLAMEDAIALANALEQYPDLHRALKEYELERRPVVETLQRAAAESQAYFESVKRYAGLPPLTFAFNLLTRSGRVSYDDLRLRDPRFGDSVERAFQAQHGHSSATFAPPPLFTPLHLRGLSLPNRIVVSTPHPPTPGGGVSSPSRGEGEQDATAEPPTGPGVRGAALVLTAPIAVSAQGRISPDCPVLYDEVHLAAWAEYIQALRDGVGAAVGLTLNHAGRRGSTRPRGAGLDRPLREGNWPLVAPSPLPYTPYSQTPRELDRAGMEAVRDDFVYAARLAIEAGVALLLLHMAHGYLLAGFLSPLTNRRTDEYGGSLENRLRFPLEVFGAVRAAWAAEKPLGVALNITDGVAGGMSIEDGVATARVLKDHGCDLLMALAGQTTPDGALPYGRGFLTPFSDRVRNEAGITTLVGGYLTTSNEVNTILAGGRADLCLVTREPALEGNARTRTPETTGSIGRNDAAAASGSVPAARPREKRPRESVELAGSSLEAPAANRLQPAYPAMRRQSRAQGSIA